MYTMKKLTDTWIHNIACKRTLIKSGLPISPRGFLKFVFHALVIMCVYSVIMLTVDVLGNPLEHIKAKLGYTGQVNPHTFPYIINNEHYCDDEARLKYIVYIYSQPTNFYRRRVIRNTWGQNNLFPDWPSRTIFIMGATIDSSIQKSLHDESEDFGDIIQKDFVDSYENLTYMGVAALKWITTNCDKSDIVIKADDDAYINMFEMRKFFENDMANRTHWFLCYLFEHGPIRRNPAKCHKWCVHESDFPGQTHFPPYCAGGAYAQDGRMVAAMYNQSLYTPFFWIEDVFVTSMIVTPVFKDVQYIDIKERYRLWTQDFNTQFAQKSNNSRQWVVGHMQRDIERLRAWKLTLKDLGRDEIRLLGKEKYNMLFNSD